MSYTRGRENRAQDSYSERQNTSAVGKWWKPKDDKSRELFDEAKSDVKTFLAIAADGVDARRSYSIFAENMDGKIDYERMGFESFAEFLFHCDDVLCLKKDDRNNYYLFLSGSAGEDVAHVRDLVENQKPGRKRPPKPRYFAPIQDLLTIKIQGGQSRTESLPHRLSSLSLNHESKSNSVQSPEEENNRTGYGRGRMLSRPLNGRQVKSPQSAAESNFNRPPSKHFQNMHRNEYRDHGRGDRSQGNMNNNTTRPFTCDRGRGRGRGRRGRGNGEMYQNHRGRYNQPEKSVRDEGSSDDDEFSSVPAPTVKNLADLNNRYQISGNDYEQEEEQRQGFSKSLPSAPTMETSSQFDARFMGCDEYGFSYLQVNSRELNASFDELKRSLRDVYSLSTTKETFHIKPLDIKLGSLLIFCVEGAFVRGKVFEIHFESKESGFVIFQYYDYGHFDTCRFENIYRVKENFKSHPPRVIKSVLVGLDEIMLTGEIGQLLPEIPMQPDVQVTVFSKRHHIFNLPVVHLETSEGEFLTDLLQSVYSANTNPNHYWPKFDTEIYLTIPQKSVSEFLKGRAYFSQ